MARALCAASAVLAVMCSPARASAGRLLGWVPGSTKKVCQLTGDYDRSANTPTISQTGKRFGLGRREW